MSNSFLVRVLCHIVAISAFLNAPASALDGGLLKLKMTERQVKLSVPYQVANSEDQAIVLHLMPYADRFQQIDDERRSVKATNKLDELDMVELQLAERALDANGLHSSWFSSNS